MDRFFEMGCYGSEVTGNNFRSKSDINSAVLYIANDGWFQVVGAVYSELDKGGVVWPCPHLLFKLYDTFFIFSGGVLSTVG